MHLDARPTATADYVLTRDRIDAAAALVRTAERSAAILDHEGADTMSLDAKAAVAADIWTGLMKELDRLDT